MPEDTTLTPAAAAVTPAPAAAIQEPPAPREPQMDPNHLPDRLKRERISTLKKLGIDIPKNATELEIDKAIEASKEKAKGRKEKLKAADAAVANAESKTASLQEDSATLKTYADLEMSRLDEPQRDLVKKLAGDSPAAQLKQIEMMKALSPKAEPVKPAMAPPAQSAPNAAAPPATQAAPANKREEYLRLRGQNAYFASQFLLDNRFEIFQQK
jgi:hypothetical protein